MLKDIQKEVYEINSWVPAGTQEYFTRELDLERLSNFKWEFVGRNLLKKWGNFMSAKLLKKIRSYGSSFIPVG